MKNAIFILALICQLLFFSVLSILGLEYRGIEESSSYVIFCVSFAALSLLIFMVDYFVMRKFSLNLNALLFFILPVFISLIYFAEQTSSKFARSFFIFYLLFSLPSTYIGIYLARRHRLESMAKWFEVVMIILTLSVISSLILPFFKNLEFSGFAGSTHQTASYTSAFAYSLNLYFILFDNRYKLFGFHYSKFYKISMYALLLVQIAGVLVSGGRGGFVVIINATILLFWFKRRDEDLSVKKILLIILFFALSTLFLLPKLIHNDLFLASTGRVFSYVSSRGIDLSQTSGRDYVFKDAVRLISEKPLTGYGLFGYYDYTFFPHNIILEILLNGGVIYLLFMILIGLLFLFKLKVIIKNEPTNLLALTLFIYPITELMFSGTYMTTSLFWFVISYVFCYKYPNIN